MKILLINVVLVLSVFTTLSQDLTTSRTSSFYTAIYKITDKEAEKLYKHENADVGESFFHTLIDLFPADSLYNKMLAPGHYLYTKTVSSQLQVELESVNNLDMTLLDNSRDLLVVFRDKNGRDLPELFPNVRSSRIRFDHAFKAYRLARSNKRGLVKVQYEGHTNFFSLQRKYNNTLVARSKRRVLSTFPINHLLSPLIYITRSTKSLISYGHVNPPGLYYRAKRLGATKEFDGYMVLNKPKYKPSDTVRMKSFIVNKKGKPFNKALTLSFQSQRYDGKSKTLAVIQPYAPGGFVFDLVLHDSLQLNLDSDYTLSFASKKWRQSFPIETFRLEQYELKNNEYKIAQAPLHRVSKPASLILKSTDANAMPLYDAHVELLVTSGKVASIYEQQLFVPDTLWFHRLKLDPIGETKITLPDSIYLNAAFEYRVSASFINTENERVTKVVNLLFDKKAVDIDFGFKADSITLSSPAEIKECTVRKFNRSDGLVAEEKIILPYSEVISGNVSRYNIYDTNGSLLREYRLKDESDGVEIFGNRTSDSLVVDVQNPKQLLLRYQLFRNNSLALAGTGKEFSITRKTNHRDTYYLSVQYLWGDEAKVQNIDFPFAKNAINIEIQHPPRVYPGEKINVSLLATNAFDKPLENVDITAYAITKKFGNVNVHLPNYETYANRKIFNSFWEVEHDESIYSRFEYERWRRTLGLDSIVFYQFLFPENGTYKHSKLAIDSITQLAPYVVSKGRIQTINYVYIDNELKYENTTANTVPYSFACKAGKVSVVLRLQKSLLTLHDVEVQKGEKLILSIDLDHLPENAVLTTEKPYYSAIEVRKLDPYFFTVRAEPTEPIRYLRQEKNYYLLNFSNYGATQLVGPFKPGPVHFQSSYSYSFMMKSHRLYTFTPQLIDRDYHSHSFKNVYLSNSGFSPRFTDEVLTEFNQRSS